MPAPSNCQLCPLHQYGTNVVNAVQVGDGSGLMVVGEGPGVLEDIQAQPFVGPTGQILRQELALRGINNYVLTNATRCFPGESKKDNELQEGIHQCHPYLLEDIEYYKPNVILALGSWAVKALGFDDPLDTLLCHVLEGPNGIPVIVSYHPAYFMRFPGSLHVFELAVYKAFRVLQGMSPGDEWEPEYKQWHEILPSKRLTIDTETDSKDATKANLVIATITDDDGTVLYNAQDKVGKEILRALWTDPTIEKNFQNGDYDVQVIERFLGAEVQGYAWDTMLAEHLLHEETFYSLEILRGLYTNQPVYERPLRLWKDEEVEVVVGTKKQVNKTIVELPGQFIKSGKNKGKPKTQVIKETIEVPRYRKQKRGKNLDGYDTVPKEILYPYAVYDSQTEHMIWQKQEKLLTDKQKTLLKDVVIPMQIALKDMERDGIKVDVGRLPEMRQYYRDEEKRLAEKVYELADEEFKLTSPVEVKRVLFEELGLPKPPVRSKITGDVSTGKKALDWLSTHAAHPVVTALEEWRKVDTIQKMFLGKPDKNGNIEKGLMAKIKGDRLHTTFRLTLETGRNASSPNLQNLPTLNKGPLREMPIADEGNLLIQADYSQIELRIAAYESQDKQLITLLESGGDVHTRFGRALYNFEPELSDKEWKEKYDAFRTLAKRFTFGRLFGQSEAGMALTFNISTEEALRFSGVYAELFPNMAQWWEDTIAWVRAGKPLETVWGRQRRFPAYKKFENIKWRGKAGMFSHMDREALNFIPQGTAADTLSKTTGNIRAMINRYNLPIALRLVVHDSLTVEASEDYLDVAARFLKEEMEGVARGMGWYIPVEIKYGRTWAGELGTYKC